MTEMQNHPNENPLESWKEIAAYLKRDVRTVKRWEKSEGLPVHRQMHQARSSVYAYPSELDAWKIEREPRLNTIPLITPWRRAVSLVGFAVVLLVALATVSSGPILSPTRAAAQQVEGTVVSRIWAGPDTDTFGAVSPDGKYLSFVDWTTGDLAIRDLATGTNRRLTNKGSWEEAPGVEAEHSIWSPDGKQIAYEWYTEPSGYQLRLISLDDPTPRVLYRCDNPQDYIEPSGWSPDGKQILAILGRKNANDQIALVSVADGAVRVLKTFSRDVDVAHAGISPDGHYVLYDHRQSEHSLARDIAMLPIEGGQETPLIEHPADDLALGWTPDGRHVLFSSDRTGTLDFWLVPVAEGKPQGAPELVKSSAGRIRSIGFTRKGAFYYGVSGRQEDVYVVKLDPETGRVLEPPRKLIKRNEGFNRWPEYSPDGKYLAYVSESGNTPYRGSRTLFIHSLETGDDREFSRQLTKAGLTYVGWPRWSPDRHSILLVDHAGIYQVNLQTGNVVHVVRSGGRMVVGFSWSHDGKVLFYGRQDRTNGLFQLVKRDLQSGNEEVLDSVAQVERAAVAASPDGRWLSTMVGDRQECILKVIAATGGVAKELYTFKREGGSLPGFHIWTSDGNYILFLRNRPQGDKWELWRIPVAGGEPQRLGLEWPRVMLQLSAHPDGQHLAFSAWSAPGRFSEIWVMENFLPAAGKAE